MQINHPQVIVEHVVVGQCHQQLVDKPNPLHFGLHVVHTGDQRVVALVSSLDVAKIHIVGIFHRLINQIRRLVDFNRYVHRVGEHRLSVVFVHIVHRQPAVLHSFLINQRERHVGGETVLIADNPSVAFATLSLQHKCVAVRQAVLPAEHWHQLCHRGLSHELGRNRQLHVNLATSIGKFHIRGHCLKMLGCEFFLLGVHQHRNCQHQG